MLTPEQVVPFLQHQDLAVREHAMRYLVGSMDRGPATADDLWRSIDRFGVQSSAMCMQHLSHLPETQGSYARLIAELGCVKDDWEREMLQIAFIGLGWETLSQNRDEVLALKSVPEAMQQHHARRLTLDAWSLDDLWGGLAQFAESGQDEDVDETMDEWYDDREGLRLIETVLRRFPQEASARAFDRARSAAVTDEADDYDGMERYCIDILGRAKERAAIPWLLKRLGTGDYEMLTGPVSVALARLGDADLVARLEAMYRDESSEVEWHTIIGILRGINIPETEAALVRLLRSERDFDLRRSLAGNLISLCASPESLDEVRILIMEGLQHRQWDRLAGQILPAASMVGFEAPEFAKWRRTLDERNAGVNADAAFLDRLTARAASVSDSAPTAHPSMAPAATTVQTILRTSPKIGRNDACPCGRARSTRSAAGTSEDVKREDVKREEVKTWNRPRDRCRLALNTHQVRASSRLHVFWFPARTFGCGTPGYRFHRGGSWRWPRQPARAPRCRPTSARAGLRIRGSARRDRSSGDQ